MRGPLATFRRTKAGAALASSPLRPRYWLDSFRAARNLLFTYGHLRTVRSGMAVDANGDPVPWYTYPAIEYLKQFDFATRRVFEYGSGSSTLFWSTVAASVVSVEDDEEWFAVVEARLPPHCRLVLEPDLTQYVDVIHQFGREFDVIVVDGPARGQTRLKCARAALDHLRAGGLIILDNSDWLPESARVLRESGLLQVDMSGFAPIAGNTQTTSFFFERSCALEPKGGRQPQPSVAAVSKNWETAPAPAGAAIACDGQDIHGVVRQIAFEKAAPDGSRRFELIARDRDGSRDVFIIDRDRQRILLGPNRIDPTETAITREAALLAALSWDEFRAFVRGHATRRYVLD
jgi:hypothetical protein